MARYRRIDIRIWGDHKFNKLSAPNPCGQFLWFYLLTNSKTNIIPGVFESGEAAMAESLSWPLKCFREAFQEVFNEGMIQADFKARLIWIPKAINYNAPESPNVVRSWSDYWDELPECELKYRIYQHLKQVMEGLGEGFSKAFNEKIKKPSFKALSNQEQEQDQQQDQEQNKKLLKELICSQTAEMKQDVRIRKNNKADKQQSHCPHEDIIAIYHEILPMCPQIRSWHRTRRANLKARWAEEYQRQNLNWWKEFFSFIAKSKFLTGQAESRSGQPPFIADLEWIVKPTNFAKIIEGKYHREQITVLNDQKSHQEAHRAVFSTPPASEIAAHQNGVIL